MTNGRNAYVVPCRLAYASRYSATLVRAVVSRSLLTSESHSCPLRVPLPPEVDSLQPLSFFSKDNRVNSILFVIGIFYFLYHSSCRGCRRC